MRTETPSRTVCLNVCFACALLALFPLGCNYIDDPMEPTVVAPTDPEQTTRRVLIEDFTGHTCPNCPSATAVGLQLQTLYGANKVVLIGAHVSDAFAAPVAPIGDGEFDTDFRTPSGDAYAADFGVNFLPVGAVNRKEYSNTILLGSGSWGSAVAEILDQPAAVDLWFNAFDFDSVNAQGSLTLKLSVLAELPSDLLLVVCITEDHIIADQIDNTQTPSHVHEYDHRHVLRGNLNGTWGEVMTAGSASVGDTTEMSYDFTLPASVLNAANCALVAYVYATSTGEIQQVAEHKFQ